MERCYLVTYKTDFKKILNNKTISRVYVGDSECDFNFIYYLRKDFYKDIFLGNKKISLLTPSNFKEQNINIFLKYLKKNIDIFLTNDIEFIVNDWGTLKILKDIGLDNEIVYGTYLYYQKKDPLSYLLSKEKNSSQDLVSMGNLSIDYSIHNSFLNDNNFKSLELFNYTLIQYIKNISLPLNLYYPKVPFSYTKYCYNNSLFYGKDFQEIVKNCSGCRGKEGQFDFDRYGYNITYAGNKYLYNSFSRKIIENFDINRIIYNYDY